MRLHSEEHAGMFISEPSGPEMASLLEGLPSSVVLENGEGERFLLLPSSCLPGRPEPKGVAFSGDIALNRCDPWWLGCVGSGVRHHLYPFHVSGALLSTPSLAAALYLLLSRFVAGQYEKVFAMVESCVTDLPLSKEEAGTLLWLGHLDHDHHPDAVACRLRITLSAIPCPAMSEALPWNLLEQVHLYVTRRGHVSASCLLTPEEELVVLDEAAAYANRE
ncbi:unnamed protein product, partial [Discosporangium mesarthrocarpum]